MKIVINSLNNKYKETICFETLDNNIFETLKEFSSIRETLEAEIFAINEIISSQKLSKYKNEFSKLNICSLHIYSNNRETILSGKSLKMGSYLILLELDVTPAISPMPQTAKLRISKEASTIITYLPIPFFILSSSISCSTLYVQEGQRALVG